jgi:hypothetical protein
MDYSGVCGIISAADQASFESGGAVGIWGYSGQYGTKRFTLPAGSYCLGIRSNSDGNSIVGEVDMDVELPESDGMYFQATPWNEVGTLTAGQKLTHGISIQAGHRYFVDGNNSGNGDVGVYVIPASELANFNAGRTFQYYADYSGEEGALPGFWELELPPGTYYLAMVNNGATTHAYTYQAEDWGP